MVASHCFLHPTLSLASEQILKDLKRSQGHQRGGEESGSGNPNHPSPPKLYYMPKIKLINIHVDSQYSLKVGGGGAFNGFWWFSRSYLVGNHISELATLIGWFIANNSK